MLSSGDRVGPFTIVAPLGVEDGANAYLAEDTRLARSVAVKVLTEAEAADARSGSRVHHPSGIAVYDVGELPAELCDGERRWFAVTELARGAPWRQVAADPAIAARTKLGWVGAARAAADAYHAAGLVHRGGIAEALVVREDGVAKLHGFGAPRAGRTADDDRRELRALRAMIDPPPRRLRVYALPLAIALMSLCAVLLARALRPRATARAEPAAAVGSAAQRCQHNIDCSSGARRDAICTNGVCVALATGECRVHASARAVQRDDTVWIGTMLPMSGDNAIVGEWNGRAIELACDDFERTMPQGAARSFGLIECDDAKAPAAALAHLLDDVRVPAVLGFGSGREVIELSPTLRDHRALALVTISTNPLVMRVPQPEPRLLFRTTYSASEAAGALGAFVSERLDRDRRAPMRVAVVGSRAGNSWLSQALFERLRFNGKPAFENGDRYREWSYDPTAASLSSDYAKIAQALVGFAPDVIVYVGESTIVDGLIAPVEKLWRRGAPPPVWLNLSTMPPELFPFLGRDAGRRKRFFGVTTTSSIPTNARFVLHYNEVYRDKITRTQSPNSSYDAFYLVAFASYAIGDRAVDGPSLSRAFERLMPPGRPVDVGVGGIYEAFTALRRGERIDVNGATGALDFDLERGESAFDQEILCVGVDDRGVANDAIESGLRYDTRTKKLAGSMRCP